MDSLNLDRSQWKLVPFGDVAIKQNESVDRETTKLKRYIAGEHMRSEDLHLREWGDVGENYLGPAFTRKFSVGDILYGSRRTYLRKVAVADFEGITANTTFVIKANEDVIIKELLPFLMLSEGFTQHSIRNSKGSVNPYINWKDIANYEFLLPPKDQQAKLAELLWAADASIEAIKDLHAQSEQFKASRTRNLLTASKEEQTTQCKLGVIPEGWKCLSLQELIESGAIVSHLDGNHGSDYPRNEEFVSSGIPYISANSIESGTVDFGKAKYLTTERAAKIRKGVAQDGDILLAHNATVGPTCELKTAEEKVILGTSLTYYRVDSEKLSSAYLLSYMKSRFFQKQLEQVMSQSTRNQVPITTQRKLMFLIPPRSKQDLVAEAVENLSKPITSALAALNTSQKLLKSLINQIF